MVYVFVREDRSSVPAPLIGLSKKMGFRRSPSSGGDPRLAVPARQPGELRREPACGAPLRLGQLRTLRKLSALGPKRPQADAEYEHEEDHSTDDVDTVDRGHAPILARKAQSQPLAVLRACGLGKRELTGQPGSMKLRPAAL
jgi:hypothetical protein